jgi:hypothetical protein
MLEKGQFNNLLHFLAPARALAQKQHNDLFKIKFFNINFIDNVNRAKAGAWARAELCKAIFDQRAQIM